MPKQPPRFAAGGKTREQRQDAAKRSVDRRRGTTAERGYGGDWQRLRAQHLRDEPLCRMCHEQGRFVPAQVVDHVVGIAEAPHRRLDPTNLRSLCKRCHDAHTARTQGFASPGKRRGGEKV